MILEFWEVPLLGVTEPVLTVGEGTEQALGGSVRAWRHQ